MGIEQHWPESYMESRLEAEAARGGYSPGARWLTIAYALAPHLARHRSAGARAGEASRAMGTEQRRPKVCYLESKRGVGQERGGFIDEEVLMYRPS